MVLNVAVTQATAPGHITVYPDGVSLPNTANLNFVAGQSVSNLVVAPVGSDGKVDLYNGSSGTVQLIADVSGNFAGIEAGALSGVESLATDGEGYCALLSSGGVDCWGGNNWDERGDGTAADTSVPTAVVGVGDSGFLSGVASLTSNGEGYCALLTSGGVDCWGSGYLGNGTSGPIEWPVAVDGVGGSGTLGGVASLASDAGGSGDSYCARLTSGGVDCWGYGGDGQLGNGTDDASSLVPVAVVGVGGTGTLGGLTGLVSNQEGEFGSYCAVLTSGGVDCWGANSDSALGSITGGSSDVPVPVVGVSGSGALGSVASITSAHADYSYCVVLTSGAADCWGDNQAGQLGDDDAPSGPDHAVSVVGVGGTGTLGGVASLGGGGYYISYCALLTSGSLDCWGSNGYDSLGDGTSATGSDVPVSVVGVGGPGTLSGVASFATGLEGRCAVMTSGGVDCWGEEQDMGAPVTESPVPLAVVGVGGNGVLSGATSITSSATVNSQSFCSVLTSGGVDCWGSDYQYLLGAGPSPQTDVPVAVSAVGS